MDIEKAINRILWGKAIVEVVDSSNSKKSFVLRSLSLSEQNEIDFLKESILNECKEEGILTEDELLLEFSKVGAWTDEDEKTIDDLAREVRKIKHSIKNCQFNVTKKKQLNKNLAKVEKQLSDLKGTKIGILSCTAEARADEFARRYIIFRSATDRMGKQLWKSEDEFLDSTDQELIDLLTIKYVENHMMSEKELREVSRSSQWRFRWGASKNGESLFGKPVAEWSDIQNSLVYWSQFYDYVYESPESPSQDIIDNDAALDAWFADKDKSSKTTSKRKAGHQEQFIVVPDGDSGTIEQINSMNSKVDRDRLSRERKQIKEKGSVSEWELRKKGGN